MLNCKDALYLKWHDAADEAAGLVELVKRMLASDPELLAREICVVAPSASWGRQFAERLAKRGIRSSCVFDGAPLTGDVRKPATCPGWRAYAKLWLAACPDDAQAQRLWGYFGSADEGAAVAERARKLKGIALVNAVAGSPAPKDFAALLGELEGDEDACALFARARDAFENPRFSPADDHVRVASYKTAAQAEAQIVILAGAIEGLVPSKACFEDAACTQPKPQALDTACDLFVAAAGLAPNQLVVSTFQLLDEATAQRLGVPVRRYKTVNGTRMAAATPSRFIEKLGDLLPGSVSGEQHMATMG